LSIQEDKKRIFEPGQMVSSLKGQAGIVLSEKAYLDVRSRFKEGKIPGHYFAPGCCPHLDYVLQVPVLFEDGTYDVTRSLNIKKVPDLSQEKRTQLLNLLYGNDH
jgi:hypothetical protein